jgi:hypothetical protein
MALAAIKGEKTLAELAKQSDIHPNHVVPFYLPGTNDAEARPL